MAAVAVSDTAAPFFAPFGALGAQRPASSPRATIPATVARIVPLPLVFIIASFVCLMSANVLGSGAGSVLPALDDLAGVLLRLARPSASGARRTPRAASPTATAFSSGESTICRDSTTCIVPLGSWMKSSRVRPKRDWTSSTAVERSGPIWAGLFTPSDRDRVADEAAGLHEPRARALLHALLLRPSPPRSGGRCGARRGRRRPGPGPCARTGRAWPGPARPSSMKLKLGMTVSWTRARGSLRCATCQAKAVFCPESRPYSYCSAALSPDVGEVGADRAAPAVDHVAGAAALLLDQLLRVVDEVGALRLPVVAVAHVAAHLHERGLVLDDRVGLAHGLAEHGLLPEVDGAVGGLHVDREALPAVAGRAAVGLGRVGAQDLRRVGLPGVVRGLEALPARGLVAGGAAVGPAQGRDPDLLHARRGRSSRGRRRTSRPTCCLNCAWYQRHSCSRSLRRKRTVATTRTRPMIARTGRSRRG